MDMESKNAGTIQASLRPRRKRTTKSDAKLLQGICSNVIPPLLKSIPKLVFEVLMEKNLLYIPHYQISSQPFRNRKALKSPILRPFSDHVAEIKD
jgi:hypothetical protein